MLRNELHKKKIVIVVIIIASILDSVLSNDLLLTLVLERNSDIYKDEKCKIKVNKIGCFV